MRSRTVGVFLAFLVIFNSPAIFYVIFQRLSIPFIFWRAIPFNVISGLSGRPAGGSPTLIVIGIIIFFWAFVAAVFTLMACLVMRHYRR